MPYDDFYVPPQSSSNDQLEPATTVDPVRSFQSLLTPDAATPQAPAYTPDAFSGLLSNTPTIDVNAPVPHNKDVEQYISQRLAAAPPVGPTGPISALRISRTLDEMMDNPQAADLKYNVAAENEADAPTNPGAWMEQKAEGLASQAPIAILQGASGIANQGLGLASWITRSPEVAAEAQKFSSMRSQLDTAGSDVADGNPVANVARSLGSTVTEMAPILIGSGALSSSLRAGGVAADTAAKIGLGSLAGAFGLTAGGSAYAQAQQSGYEHPDLYALGTGIIAGGTALLPGYKGANAVVQGAEMIESKPWAEYLSETINKYASKDLLQTHGGAMALQNVVQTVLQGALNKATVDKSTTWTGIAEDALKSAGFGVLLGEGFGALHQSDANAAHANVAAAKDQYLNSMFKDFSNSIEQSQLQGGQATRRVVDNTGFEGSVPPDNAGSFSFQARNTPSSIESAPETPPATQAPETPNATAPAASAPVQPPGGDILNRSAEDQATSAQNNSPSAWGSLIAGVKANAEAAKPAEVAPVEPAKVETPAASISPVAEAAPTPTAGLPKRGETIPLGTQFQATRNARNQVVLQEVGGEGRTLAVLKSKSVKTIDKADILNDLKLVADGKKSKVWEFNTKVPNNPLLNTGKTEVVAETTQADPEAFMQSIADAATVVPTGVALKEAIHSGSLDYTTANNLVGAVVAKKGPEAVAAKLQSMLDKGIKQYNAGKLKHRTEVGSAGDIPAEQKDAEGNLLPPKERKAVLPDKNDVAARVLDILTDNKRIDAEAGEAAKAQAVGGAPSEEREVENATGDPNAIAPVDKSGFTDESARTGFTDEQLKTGGKIDPKKVRLNAEYEEIKAAVHEGDTSQYDRGIEILKSLGLKQAEAERWMDSPLTADYHTPGETIGAASPDKFASSVQYHLFQERKLLGDKLLPAIVHIAESPGDFQLLAQQLMVHASDLDTVKLGTQGGVKAGAHYDSVANAVKIPATVPVWELAETTMHEALHGLAFRRLGVLPPDAPEVQELSRIMAATQMADKSGLDKRSADRVAYALSNQQEMLAMGLSNPETIAFLKSIPMEGQTAWQRFKAWVYNLATGRSLYTADQRVRQVFDRLMERPAVSDSQWSQSTDPFGTSDVPTTAGAFPAISGISDYNMLKTYKYDELPDEQRELITRKAKANNTWIQEPDIKAIMAKVPEGSQSVLDKIIGARAAVLKLAEAEPTGKQPSSYYDIMADPTVNADDKGAINYSVLSNLLQFEGSAKALHTRFEGLGDKLRTRIPKIEYAMSDLDAQRTVAHAAIDEVVGDFKNRVLREKEISANDVRMETLTRMTKVLDQVRGSRTAMSKYMTAVSDAVPLDELLTITSPSKLTELIKERVPITSEVSQKIGVSEDMMRMAGVIMANSNSLREALLDIHFSRDQATLENAAQFGEAVDADVKSANWNNLTKNFATKVSVNATREERAASLWKALNKEKTSILKQTAKYAGAVNAVDSIMQSKSYRALKSATGDYSGLVKVMSGHTADGQLVYTHPITREKVAVDASPWQEAKEDNLRKQLDIAVGAKNYLATPDRKGYDPTEAAFWRNYVLNSDFNLDPMVNLDARRLIQAKYDPYKLVQLGGGLVSIPQHVLDFLAGPEAAHANTLLEAQNAMHGQLATVKGRLDAAIDNSVPVAAAAHGLSARDWNDEVLQPMIMSRQTAGYKALKAGDKTLYGHEILPTDETALQAQRAMSRGFFEVALNKSENPAIAANPTQIVFKAPDGSILARKVTPTGPDTMPRHLGQRARVLASQWSEARTIPAKIALMDSNFIPLVMSHIDTVGAPDYSVNSGNRDLYKAALREHSTDAGGGFDNVESLAQFMFDAQTDRDPERQISKQQIITDLVAELDKGMQNINKGYKASDTEKPEVTGVGSFIGSDNSFTQERGKLIAPPGLYETGLTYNKDRLAHAHAATQYTAVQFAGEGGALDRLLISLQKAKNTYEAQVKELVRTGQAPDEQTAKKSVQARTDAEQLKGSLLVTYEQALQGIKQVSYLRTEARRLLQSANSGLDSPLMDAGIEAQAWTVTNLLAGVLSRVKHLTGGGINLMDFNKVVLGKSSAVELARMGARAAVLGYKELGAMASKIAPILSDRFADQIALHRHMETIGLASTANIKEDIKALWATPTGIGKPVAESQSRTKANFNRLASLARTISEPLKAVTTRPVDRFLNGMSILAARDVENLLMDSSVRAGNIRHDLGDRGVFTSPEIFGDKDANAKQELMLRGVFKHLSLNMDSLMWKYRDAVAASVAQAHNPSEVSFFDAGQRAAFQRAVASGITLPDPSNRPTAVRGSRGRNLAGQFWGFHLWNASRSSMMLARASTDASTYKYVPQLTARLATIAMLGAAGLMTANKLKKLVYNEVGSVPDITDAKNPHDAGIAMLNALAGYTPIVGGLISGPLVLNQSFGTGFDPVSQFPMLSLVNDIYKTISKVSQTGDALRPTLQFVSRWAPLTRAVLNRLPVESGLTDYYNVARDLKNLAPADMPSAKRGGGQFDATPTTPIVQDMLNAAYRGDQEGFQASVDKFLVYEESAAGGSKSPQEAQQSLKASFRSHNPYVMEFGRLPTEAERDQIYAAASDAQRQELDKTQQIFDNYGAQLGLEPQETKEARQSTGGGSSGFSNSIQGSRAFGASAPYEGSMRQPESILSNPVSGSAVNRQPTGGGLLSGAAPETTNGANLLGSPTAATNGGSSLSSGPRAPTAGRGGNQGASGLGGGGGGSLRLGGGGSGPRGGGGGAGHAPRLPAAKGSLARAPKLGLGSGGKLASGSKVKIGALRLIRNPLRHLH